jgi:hypothetical protein
MQETSLFLLAAADFYIDMGHGQYGLQIARLNHSRWHAHAHPMGEKGQRGGPSLTPPLFVVVNLLRAKMWLGYAHRRCRQYLEAEQSFLEVGGLRPLDPLLAFRLVLVVVHCALFVLRRRKRGCLC